MASLVCHHPTSQSLPAALISYSWMVGPDWPSSGEIDIIEGVNLMTTNQMTLHTSPGCTVSVGSGGQSGSSVGDPACGDGSGYNGCPVVSNTGTSYGTPFDNVKGGGVYAMQWTASNIKIWYFPRNSVPSDISSGKPNPGGWGQPQANFAGCDFSSYMKNQNIIFGTYSRIRTSFGSYRSTTLANPL